MIGRVIDLRHRPQHFPRERAADGGHADDRGGLQRLDRGRGSRRSAHAHARSAACARRGPVAVLDDESAANRSASCGCRASASGGRRPSSRRPRGRRCRSRLRRRRGTGPSGPRGRRRSTRSADSSPASATAAVPWMSSLKRADRGRGISAAAGTRLWLAKSSNWITTPGNTSRAADDELLDRTRRRRLPLRRVCAQADVKRIAAAAPRCWCRRRASPAGNAFGWTPAQAV